MKLILTLIALTFLTPFFVFSQNNSPKRNIEIYDQLSFNSFDELENRIVLAGKENVFSINLVDTKDSDDYLLMKLRQRLNAYNVVYETDIDSVFADIKIDNIKLQTLYKKIGTSKIFGDKTVDREIAISYNVTLVRKDNGEILYTERIADSFSDSFNLDELNRMESGEYEFVRAPLPEEGFLSKYLLPVVLLGVSAVTIILFFVIRSE
jgi:hypothetical protein